MSDPERTLYAPSPRPGSLVGLIAGLLLACPPIAVAGAAGDRPETPDVATRQLACARLAEPAMSQRMDGVLRKLTPLCEPPAVSTGADRPPSAGTSPDPAIAATAGSGDVRVSDPLADHGSASQVQSETFLARSAATGTLCSAFNDTSDPHLRGSIGFARSTDGGRTWDDRGPLFDPQGDLIQTGLADPSVVWSPADGNFYFGALIEVDGLGAWRSTDDCRTVEFLGVPDACFMNDKPLLTVDDHPGSPYYGRLYMAWTNFCLPGEIQLRHSSDGGQTWSAARQLTANDGLYQGAWPVTAPNGDLYVGWVRWHGAFTSIDIDIVRSTDGGDTFAPVTRPLVGATNPADATATAQCQRPALGGGIRYLPSPQLVVGADGTLHVVYSYDPDGPDQGDTIDVYYRRSDDAGLSWSPEIRLNDDATDHDQFYPTLDLSPDGLVAVTWYDRRYDPQNLLVDYQQRLSLDGGTTWRPSTRLSDVSSPIYLAPELAPCYHGDYDKVLAASERVVAQWADDRRREGGRPDPDVYAEATPVAVDYLLQTEPEKLEVCSPDTAMATLDLPSFQGFSQPVQLAVAGVPDGVTAAVTPNPVTAGSAATLLLGNSAAAAAGRFELVVTGTAQPGGVQRTARLGLAIAHTAPATPVPVHPPDGATGVARRPVLEWQAVAGAPSYVVEVATDAGFGQVVYTADTIESRHRVAQFLAERGDYHWRVRATNGCGASPASASSTLRIRPRHYLLLIDQDDLSPDVLPIYEEALIAAGLDFDIWDYSRSQGTLPTAADLQPYPWVLWFSGNTLDPDAGPTIGDRQQALTTWLAQGERCLLLTSQDFLTVFVDPVTSEFYSDTFGVLSTDGPVSEVSGAGWLQPLGARVLAPPFQNRARAYEVDPGSEVLFAGGGAAAGSVKTLPSGSRAALLSFALEGLPSLGDRVQVLRAFADHCVPPLPGAEIFRDDFESGGTALWDATVEGPPG